MNLVKIFSVLGLVAMASACGSSQPTTAALGNAAYNPAINPVINPGYNPVFNQGYSSSYFGNQQIAYGNTLQASAYVQAGERINVNPSAGSYMVGDATCGHQWFNTIHTTGMQGSRPLTNLSVSLNGQVLSGSTVAPATGTLTVTATLDPIHVRCTSLYQNQAAEIQYYIVNLGNAVTR